MKLRETLVLALVFSVVISVSFSAAGAASIPNWVKGVAGWWSQDKISDQEFLQGIDYLISSGAIKPKILEEKDAKIKDLEAKLAKYQNAEIAAAQVKNDRYSDLRQITKSWVSGQLSDDKYLAGVQTYVNSGLIGPFSSYKSAKCCTDSDKKAAIANYKSYATAWAAYGLDDDYFFKAVDENLFAKNLLSNPKGAKVVQSLQAEEQQLADDQVSKQAAIDSSQAKLMDNAKKYLYGYISTETYLENIVQYEKDGVFDPFKTTSQKLRGDVFFTDKSIQNIMNNKMAFDGLQQANKKFVDSQVPTGYLSDLISVFNLSSS